MRLRNTPHGYGAIAKFLHWGIVILIIAQYVLAEAAEELEDGLWSNPSWEGWVGGGP